MSKVDGREILLHDLGMSHRRENMFEDILHIIMSIARITIPFLHFISCIPILYPTSSIHKLCSDHPTTPIHLFTDIAAGRKTGAWGLLFVAGNGRKSIENVDDPQQAA
jgi:hypothetical protein